MPWQIATNWNEELTSETLIANRKQTLTSIKTISRTHQSGLVCFHPMISSLEITVKLSP